MQFEINSIVVLKKPYRGYKTADIIGGEYPYFIVAFPSGDEECFHVDDFEEL